MSAINSDYCDPVEAALLEVERMRRTGELEVLPDDGRWPMVPRRGKGKDRDVVRAFEVLASSEKGSKRYERGLAVFKLHNLKEPTPRVISVMYQVAHRGYIDAELVFDFLYDVPSVRQIARIAKWLGAYDREIGDWCWLGE